jgi:hypothetical protein
MKPTTTDVTIISKWGNEALEGESNEVVIVRGQEEEVKHTLEPAEEVKRVEIETSGRGSASASSLGITWIMEVMTKPTSITLFSPLGAYLLKICLQFKAKSSEGHSGRGKHIQWLVLKKKNCLLKRQMIQLPKHQRKSHAWHHSLPLRTQG